MAFARRNEIRRMLEQRRKRSQTLPALEPSSVLLKLDSNGKFRGFISGKRRTYRLNGWIACSLERLHCPALQESAPGPLQQETTMPVVHDSNGESITAPSGDAPLVHGGRYGEISVATVWWRYRSSSTPVGRAGGPLSASCLPARQVSGVRLGGSDFRSIRPTPDTKVLTRSVGTTLCLR